jgi:hypothetical protein
LALANFADILATVARETHTDEFVIGLLIDQYAIAFDYRAAETAGVINGMLGPYPILLVVNEMQVHAYHREVNGEVLTFNHDGTTLSDDQTKTTWDEVRGFAMKGSLKGEVLSSIPWISAYKWAWVEFYPESASYPP